MNSRVTTVGTCRIYHPVRMAAARRSDIFCHDNRRAYGYIHTASEAYQQVRYLTGDLKIPLEVWPFLAEGEYRAAPSEELPLPTALIVEVSSFKSVVYEKFYLKINRFNDVLMAGRVLGVFWSNSSQNDRIRRKAELQNIQSYNSLSAADKDVVEGAYVEREAQESIRAHICSIRCMYRELLVVGHCNARTADGAWIEERLRLRSCLEEIASTEQLAFYDPSRLLEVWGQRRAMPNRGLDTAHYVPEFARAIGEEMFEAALRGGVIVNNLNTGAVVHGRFIEENSDMDQYVYARAYKQLRLSDPSMKRAQAWLALAEFASPEQRKHLIAGLLKNADILSAIKVYRDQLDDKDLEETIARRIDLVLRNGVVGSGSQLEYIAALSALSVGEERARRALVQWVRAVCNRRLCDLLAEVNQIRGKFDSIEVGGGVSSFIASIVALAQNNYAQASISLSNLNFETERYSLANACIRDGQWGVAAALIVDLVGTEVPQSKIAKLQQSAFKLAKSEIMQSDGNVLVKAIDAAVQLDQELADVGRRRLAQQLEIESRFAEASILWMHILEKEPDNERWKVLAGRCFVKSIVSAGYSENPDV